MSADTPLSANIYSYQVGFGDCFLLRFNYSDGAKRHVLIDFGSTGGPKDDSAGTRMLRIAKDIEGKCKEGDGRLTAVVATHRHADHISGFATNKSGTASGDTIRALKPRVVLQPWTEQPDLPEDAEGPLGTPAVVNKSFASLRSMNATAQGVVDLISTARHMVAPAVASRLEFLGEDNVKNLAAVQNLSTMGEKPVYTFYGDKDPLAIHLPGVRTTVLGPPTLRQSASIRKMRSRDDNEFWQLQSKRLGKEVDSVKATDEPFPASGTIQGSKLPMSTRWIARRVRDVRGSQLLQIVTALDKAMNNTSLILLFEVGGKKLLFPGDAQIESWSYALGFEDVKALLADVDLYKVGHHGSRNATPKSLWNSFTKKADQPVSGRLKTMLSTMPGKHGDEGRRTEVPRKSLLEEFTKHSDLHNTHDLPEGQLYAEVVIEFGEPAIPEPLPAAKRRRSRASRR